ncbi:MAG: EamA family transporter [Pseudomonadota bacterium]
MNWYTYSLLALILLGSQRFLYKVSAERNCNTGLTTFTFMTTVTILSIIFFFILGEPVGNIKMLVAIGSWNSIAFVIATITHIESLKHIPASVVYTIIRLNIVIVIIFSIIYFNDKISFFQIAGILLSIAVVLVLRQSASEEEGSSINLRRGFILAFISLFAGAMAVISSKFAALHTNSLAFIAYAYGLGMVLSFGLKKRLEPNKGSDNATEAFIIGIAMGLMNLGGYYAFLQALAAGPLSVIGSIMGMHFVIAIILSAVIFKERITAKRAIGITMTITSVILLRL